jgi:predicted component of type VI protein secretion system
MYEIDTVIKSALSRYEPRAKVKNIVTNLQPDANSISISLTFQVVSSDEIVTLETNITRLR